MHFFFFYREASSPHNTMRNLICIINFDDNSHACFMVVDFPPFSCAVTRSAVCLSLSHASHFLISPKRSSPTSPHLLLHFQFSNNSWPEYKRVCVSLFIDVSSRCLSLTIILHSHFARIGHSSEIMSPRLLCFCVGVCDVRTLIDADG